MTEAALYPYVLVTFAALAVVAFVVLVFRPAPYGRHGGKGEPTLTSRNGWILMEAPAALGMLALAAVGRPFTIGTLLCLALWEVHYLHRAFIYPFGLPNAARMPLAVVASGALFQVVNTYLVGRWLFTLGPDPWSSEADMPRVVLGVLLFDVGFLLRQQADRTLKELREPGETGYAIPHGGLYRYVSCPNYLCEIVQWVGFWVVCWSPPSLVFAAWTAANLVPRALAHHRWYRERFPDYPPERRALVPFLL
jgi:3-oxo-5-alpha-steroid 4-dehydrogenase 1